MSWSNAGLFDQFISQIKRHDSRSKLSESGHPRNIPDSCLVQSNAPKDIQVVLRKGDHTGINSLITNIPLQQFRQMIGLQSSSTYDRRACRRPQFATNLSQPLSSSSSSSSSSLPQTNIRLVNNLKQRTQDSILSSFSSLNEINYSGANNNNNTNPTTINEQNLTTCQEIRRTGVANTLHIAIEKCYEQLNYIRDSYAETESKIGIQTLQKSNSINDQTNSNFSTLSNNPSRVDRLIAEYHYEYTRIVRLYDRIQENLTIQDIEATKQTLDEWFNAINNVQERRRQEIDNAAEKCRSGEPRLPDEKDVLQLAEALRILRITTRKIRTVLWYWLYWSTNSTTNKIPLTARHQDEQIDQYDDQRKMLLVVNASISSNENNKENECND